MARKVSLGRDVCKAIAEAMVEEALRDLRPTGPVEPSIDVSISSMSYGFEATPELAVAIEKEARRKRLSVERDLRMRSYFTFRKAGGR